MKDMELITRQEPGLVEFYNFEDLKTILEAELVRYQNIAYSEDDLKEAMADQKKLKDLRKAIDDKRKEIKKIYMQPYEVVEAQTKELIALIDAPLKAIGTYLDSAKEAEKEQKRQEIRAFYDREATPLGELADALFANPSFWNPKWELKSAKAKMWQDEIREKNRTGSGRSEQSSVSRRRAYTCIDCQISGMPGYGAGASVPRVSDSSEGNLHYCGSCG